MERIAVFGYGSLVDPASASLTLGRPVAGSVPARLSGWTRRWSEVRDNLRCEKTFARLADRSLPDHVLGLNVERAVDGQPGPNGVLIEVTEGELERLDTREVRYERVEVTEATVALTDGRIDGGGPAAAEELELDRIVTYVAKPDHFAPQPPPGAVILASYLNTIESAFAALGAAHLDLYGGTCQAPPVEVCEACLVRDAIPPGNPRAW